MLYFCISSIQINQMWQKSTLFYRSVTIWSQLQNFLPFWNFFSGTYVPVFLHFSMPWRWILTNSPWFAVFNSTGLCLHSEGIWSRSTSLPPQQWTWLDGQTEKDYKPLLQTLHTSTCISLTFSTWPSTPHPEQISGTSSPPVSKSFSKTKLKSETAGPSTWPSVKPLSPVLAFWVDNELAVGPLAFFESVFLWLVLCESACSKTSLLLISFARSSTLVQAFPSALSPAAGPPLLVLADFVCTNQE